MLTLQIKEKEIENLTPDEEFIRGTVGAKCQINFDDFWQYYEKYVVFKRVGYEPINIMVDSLENEIEIPYTILAEIGEFKIGVFGITETETLPTLYSKDIKILYGTDTHGTTPPTYIPSEIDQLRLSKQDKLTAGNGIKIENNVISSSGTIDYELLENKPQINGIELLGDKSLSELGINIPTKTSDLENDSGFIDDAALENYYTKTEVDEKMVVDQTYNPDSENAQSGKAVAEAVATEQNRADNTFANALKGSKSGSAILIDDVSPVEHTMTVKVSSDTVADLTAVKVTRCGKNLFDISSSRGFENQYKQISNTINGNVLSITSTSATTAFLELGTFTKGTYTLSFNGRENTYKFIEYGNDFTNTTRLTGVAFQASPYTFTLKRTLKIWLHDTGFTKGTSTLSNIQLELNSTATDYEVFDRTDYTPNADGTVEDVTSLYPNTTLMTDTEGVIIDCEYNRDINKAFAALEVAIATNNS